MKKMEKMELEAVKTLVAKSKTEITPVEIALLYDGLINRDPVISLVFCNYAREVLAKLCARNEITNKANIDEISQASFLKTLEKIGAEGFIREVHPIGFMYGVARYKIMEFRQAQRRAIAVVDIEDAPIILDSWQPIMEQIQNKELANILSSIITIIGEPCKTLLTMHYIEGYKYKDILTSGKVVGINTDGGLRNRASDCINKIRENYSQLLEESRKNYGLERNF
jgi:DNA-directed RNA polymerase specialized sigma24 family protein